MDWKKLKEDIIYCLEPILWGIAFAIVFIAGILIAR